MEADGRRELSDCDPAVRRHGHWGYRRVRSIWAVGFDTGSLYRLLRDGGDHRRDRCGRGWTCRFLVRIHRLDTVPACCNDGERGRRRGIAAVAAACETLVPDGVWRGVHYFPDTGDHRRIDLTTRQHHGESLRPANTG